MFGRIRKFLARRSIRAAAPVSGAREIPQPLDPVKAYRARLLEKSGPEPWCVDSVTLEGRQLDVHGWAIPPSGAVERVGFSVNGARVLNVAGGNPRPDVGSFYWYYANADHSGFHFRYEFADDPPPVLRLSYLDTLTGKALAAQHDFHLRSADLGKADEVNGPPLALVQRTHTGNSVDQYFAEGYSIFRTLDDIYHALAGRSLSQAGDILDFGCGPGRITRYLLAPENRVAAVDVDTECLEWCRENLTGAHYATSPLRPPLDLPGGSFACVLAINVLLHLREADALAWVAEWARLLRRGGLLIVTIASATALTRARLSAEHYGRLEAFEYFELSRNPDLDEVIPDRDYYKNVFYAHSYVERRWTALGYDLLRIVPGAIGNHHDVVILRKI